MGIAVLIGIPITIDGLDTNPKNPLYGLEKVGEKIKNRAHSQEIKWQISIAQERTKEFTKMTEKGESQKYSFLLKEASERFEEACRLADDENSLEKIKKALKEHENKLECLKPQLTGKGLISTELSIRQSQKSTAVLRTISQNSQEQKISRKTLENLEKKINKITENFKEKISSLENQNKAVKLSNVPKKSNMLAYINLDKIWSDSELNKIINNLEGKILTEKIPYRSPENCKSIMKQFENKLGLSLKELHEIILFCKISTENSEGFSLDEKNPYFGLLITSDWLKQDLKETLENRTKIKKAKYCGKTIYTIEDRAGRKNSIALLGFGEYVAGTQKAVLDVIDIINKDGNDSDETVMNKFNELDDGFFKYSVKVPPLEKILTNKKMIKFGSILGIDKISYSAGKTRKKENKIEISTSLYFHSEDSARIMKNNIDALQSLGAESFPNGYKKTFKNIQTYKQANKVGIKLRIGIEKIMNLVDRKNPTLSY